MADEMETAEKKIRELNSTVEFLRSRRGDLCIERDKAREAIRAALEAINPPDRGGISLADWNERLKAVSAQMSDALTYDNRKARAALSAVSPEEE